MSEPIEVLITVEFKENQIQSLQEAFPRLNVTLHPTRHTEEIPAEIWENAEVLYTLSVLPEPEQAPKLRWVQFHSAGVDKQISAPILKKSDVIATSLSGANAQQVAEHTIAMMLALGHKIPTALAHQGRHEWSADRFKLFVPRELYGSTVGIVGYGSIGRQLARLLHQFEVKVLATKQNAMQPEDDGYTPEAHGDPQGDYFERLYPPQALGSMFSECDFVAVTVPLTDETRGMIGAQQLAAMKSSAFLIDVSRGGVVDQEALVSALSERKIAGAALDVFEAEPLPTDSPLWELRNVIITPHIAGGSYHYNDRALTLFKENMQRYLDKTPLFNQVNIQKGY
jgi:phosphoglycerate dehydrogenase-like enzyme